MIALRRNVALPVGLLAAAHFAPYTMSWLAYLPGRSAKVQAKFPSMFGIGRNDSIALTFDDGPHPDGTPLILDTLERLGWKATFFVVGADVRSNPELVERIVEAGHEIGIHGDTHRSFLTMAPPEAIRDLQRARRSVQDAVDAPVHYFRPPYGSLSASAVMASRANGLRPVLWSAWGRDWTQDVNAHSVANTVRSSALAGATVLLHDGSSVSSPGNWQAAAGALTELSADINRLGLRTATISEHLEFR